MVFNAMIKFYLSYGPLIWIFCSRKTNNIINKLHERELRITFRHYFRKYTSHHKNIKNALAITGAIRGSSNEKMYQELGFEYSSMVKDILSFL